MNSVYLKAMEIGYSHPYGIKYFDLKKKIEEETNIVFNPTMEPTFMKWVGDYFDSTYYSKEDLNQDIEYSISFFRDVLKVNKKYEQAYNSFSFRAWVIKGETVKHYLDYLELQESRKTAIEAKRQANVSTWLALGAIIISIVLGLVSLLYTQDVRIVENNPRVEQLEKENVRLKDELYKAELMLDAYESDTLKNIKPVKRI
ncbi:hypothetical protein [Allomuricauda sp. M10]|uniref:hypothetical protein n=1 Tax=Allomuricauda sp. M10 TaxID=2683292 RepID=UPI001D19318F|nr:hypothetical protein [Muricauda sp. M10]